ncbi:DUF6247 family protein [Kutzneria sp. NPDC052558]|uniref:DUF6247 family protein n=1 Tax=Kutzneria sp. NPDC052558 TaxID=3364121 RepID=UPI0037CBA988
MIVDIPADALARLEEIGASLPLSLRFEFERERDIVLAETGKASSYVSLSVLLVKWRAVAEAEAREPGISHRVLAEVAEYVTTYGNQVEGGSTPTDATREQPTQHT